MKIKDLFGGEIVGTGSDFIVVLKGKNRFLLQFNSHNLIKLKINFFYNRFGFYFNEKITTRPVGASNYLRICGKNFTKSLSACILFRPLFLEPHSKSLFELQEWQQLRFLSLFAA